VGKFAASLNVKKSKMSQLALTLLTRGSTPELCWGLFIWASQLHLGGLQLSSAGTD